MVNLKRLPIVLKPGNSGKNSGGTAHSGGIKKKVIAFEELPFSRFDRNDRNVLYYLR